MFPILALLAQTAPAPAPPPQAPAIPPPIVYVPAPPPPRPAGPVTLDSDPAKAALACGPALVSQIVGKDPDAETNIEAMTTGIYFATIAAVPEKGPDGFQLRVVDSLRAMARLVRLPGGSDATLAACDARFPRARSDRLPTLPADTLDRDLLCTGALNFVHGAVRSLGRSKPVDSLGWVPDAWARYFARATVERALHPDAPAETLDTAINRRLIASVELGNYYRIALACRDAG